MSSKWIDLPSKDEVSIVGPVTVDQGTTPWVVSGSVTTSPNVNIHDSLGNALSSTAGSLNVDVTNIVPVSQSGTWNIATVTTLTSITNPVAVTQSTSPWVISGNVTANAGTNLNTSALALDTTVAGLLTDAQLRASPVPISGTVTANQGTSPWVISGAVITSPDVNIHDSSGGTLNSTTGSLNVDVTNIVPVSQSGTWNIATVTTLTSITNPVAVTQSGTWSVGRTWTLASGTDSVSAVQSGNWSTRTLDGAGNAINSTSNALNVSVQNATLAVTQSTSPWVVSGTVGVSNLPTTVDTNYGTVGASTLRSAAQIGNATGAALFGAGTTTAQVLRVVLPTDQTAIPATQSGTWNIGTVTTITNPVAVTQSTSPWVSNISQFGGVNISTGTGASGTGIPRVTVSNDSNILATQSGTWVVNQGTAGVSPWAENLTQVSGSAISLGQKTSANSLPVVIASDQSAVLVAQSTSPWVTKDQADGPVTPGAVASFSQLAGGQFNVTLPTLTDTQQVALQTDSNGRLIVTNAPIDGSKATYSAAFTGSVAANTPTDVFTITGSATKTIRVIRVILSGYQNAASTRDILLIKRSTANSGGTSTSAFAVPHDSSNAAGTATVLAYTVNPSLGVTVGTIRSRKIALLANNNASATDPTVWEFGDGPEQAIVLRGTGQVLAINLNGVTSSNNSFNAVFEWTEE